MTTAITGIFSIGLDAPMNETAHKEKENGSVKKSLPWTVVGHPWKMGPWRVVYRGQ
jgi:hypothetical protein